MFLLVDFVLYETHILANFTQDKDLLSLLHKGEDAILNIRDTLKSLHLLPSGLEDRYWWPVLDSGWTFFCLSFIYFKFVQKFFEISSVQAIFIVRYVSSLLHDNLMYFIEIS